MNDSPIEMMRWRRKIFWWKRHNNSKYELGSEHTDLFVLTGVNKLSSIVKMCTFVRATQKRENPLAPISALNVKNNLFLLG